jgi:hypothetical protein
MIFKDTPEGTTVRIDRSGHHAGDERAFHKWMDEFSVLDKRQIAEMQRMRDGKR